MIARRGRYDMRGGRVELDVADAALAAEERGAWLDVVHRAGHLGRLETAADVFWRHVPHTHMRVVAATYHDPVIKRTKCRVEHG